MNLEERVAFLRSLPEEQRETWFKKVEYSNKVYDAITDEQYREKIWPKNPEPEIPWGMASLISKAMEAAGFPHWGTNLGEEELFTCSLDTYKDALRHGWEHTFGFFPLPYQGPFQELFEEN